MASPTQITFSYKQIAEALVRQADLHEGMWGIYAEFGIGAANVVSPGQEIAPAAIVPIVKFGLQRVDEVNALSVDAAVVNPPASKSR